MAPLRLSFIIRSTYDLLPSKANLVKWGKEEDPSCPLCQKRQSMEHVLSSCKVALADGRYTWRHNRVLEEVALSIFSNLEPEAASETAPAKVFCSEGGKKKWIGRKQGALKSENVLGSATDWEIAADLPDWRNYPHTVKETGRRPDIVLWSESSAKMFLIELTVPYESRVEVQHQFKLAKYEDLAKELQSEGHTTKVMPTEVGA